VRKVHTSAVNGFVLKTIKSLVFILTLLLADVRKSTPPTSSACVSVHQSRKRLSTVRGVRPSRQISVFVFLGRSPDNSTLICTIAAVFCEPVILPFSHALSVRRPLFVVRPFSKKPEPNRPTGTVYITIVEIRRTVFCGIISFGNPEFFANRPTRTA